MKVIIDIPNFIYRTLIETGKYGFYRFDAKKAIKYGTPLDSVLDKIREEVLEYIDDLDIAAEICDIFDKYKAERSE